MKKIIILILVLGTFSYACEDVLDKEPLDMITDSALWGDETLIDSYLTQAYAEMYVFVNEVGSDEDYKNKLWSAWSDINGISDECRNQWASTVQPWKCNGIKVEGGLLEWWENSYSVIRKLNEFIQRVPKSPVGEDFKRHRIAEARFLRAYSYFSMVKRYGGVPLITTPQSPNDPEDELYPKREKEQKIYDFIISEMEAISNDLPEMPEEIGRPGKYAAKALLSRAALYAGSIAKYGTVQLDGVIGIQASLANDYFQKAYDNSREIITSGRYSLYKENADKTMNFRELFLKKNNSEVIFVVPHTFVDANAGGNGWSYDFFQCPAPQAWGGGNQDGPYLEMVEEFEHINGTSGRLDRTAIQQGLWSIDELWANKDPRFFATIYTQGTLWKGQKLDWHNGIIREDGTIQTDGSYKGIPAVGTQRISNAFGSSTCFGVLKYLDESKDNFTNRNGSGTDWIVFRYGEVLLNYAEAAQELGLSDGLWAINQIRGRAGIAPLASIDMDKIRHERKVELAFEGHRYWDLRRWRIAVDELTRDFSGLRYILDFSSNKFKLEVLNKIDGIPGPVFFSHNYYLPIGISRRANNHNLVENPGY